MKKITMKEMIDAVKDNIKINSYFDIELFCSVYEKSKGDGYEIMEKEIISYMNSMEYFEEFTSKFPNEKLIKELCEYVYKTNN
ncbi:hypothetical protein [Delftia tsuruhatensis]|uniref:hypothetical protein n=1 Tax=Delftia tsuruhatensis TaxID=180282 RepID=UPI0008E6A7B8|nr:hypothetical protein [Delftia tsuruhatensis]SFB29181.1 hypothetical protein SAMN05444579_103589 [Delftia tsuruhatensis]